jgi:DNA-binding CsgD family transcriptional regulator
MHDEAIRLRRLTDRQREVLWRVADGSRQQDVAADMGISTQTLKNHLRLVYKSVGARSLLHALHLVGWLKRPLRP